MSLMMFQQYENGVLLFTDTLTATENNEPASFNMKRWEYPHMRMITSATGVAEFARAWNSRLADTGLARDVEEVNADAQRVLNDYRAQFEQAFGVKMPRSTIYHFGFPEGSDILVRYKYSSVDNFAPERYVVTDDDYAKALLVKGVPPEFDCDLPATIEDWIAIAERAQAVNIEAMKTDQEGGVPIGGELYMTRLDPANISTTRVHRFADYDECREAMVARAKAGAAS